MAKVLGINISLKKGVVKNPVKEVECRINHGIVGDAHAGPWHRQISLLGIESYKKMEDYGLKLKQGSFAENITTKGIVLYDLPIGQILQIGEVILEVTQIGKECHTGCAISQKVGDCVMPKEGIFAKVLHEGFIREESIIEII